MHAWLVAFRPHRLRMLARPQTHSLDGRSFVFRPGGQTFRTSLPFEWESLDPALPSLHGTIVLRRFGPIVLLGVDARYRVAADLSGRLLRESVGRKNCLHSLRSLCRCLRKTLSEAEEPVHALHG